MARKKIKVGDVFYIPFQKDNNGFGQIVSDKSKRNKLYVLFDYISKDIPNLDVVTKKPIFTIAHLDDFSLEDNSWTIIGNDNVALKNIKFPNYLQGSIVEDYEGNFLRYATDKDFKELNYRDTSSSGIFNSIIKAKYFGNDELLKNYSYYLFDSSKWINDVSEETDINTNGNMGQKINTLENEEDHDEEESSEEQIALYFKLRAKGFGTEEDIARKYEIEELLDSALRKNDLGDCDGGEIGNGEMIIFCYVNDLEKGIEVIKQELEKNGYLEGCKISTLSEMF